MPGRHVTCNHDHDGLPGSTGAALHDVMITPEQAAGSAVQDADVLASSDLALTTTIEARVDAALTLHGCAVVSSRLVQGALLAATEIIREMERRYRRAGWCTILDDATLTILRPA